MGRAVRFLFALPLALAVTVANATLPPPPPVEERDDRAVTEPPELEIEIDEDDKPKFYLDYSDRSGDRDAQPISRDAPVYPEICLTTAKPLKSVFVEFDVTPEGTTDNVRVVESTNPCLNQAATDAVRRWTYEPKIIDGEPAWRRGVQTVISFELVEP